MGMILHVFRLLFPVERFICQQPLCDLVRLFMEPMVFRCHILMLFQQNRMPPFDITLFPSYPCQLFFQSCHFSDGL